MLQTGASNNLNVHGEPRHRRFHGSARFRFFHTFQTEYFRATAARKYLVSPRIADCAPGLAAGFDSFTLSRRIAEMPRQSSSVAVLQRAVTPKHCNPGPFRATWLVADRIFHTFQS